MDVKADDSFLEAMVSEQQLADVHQARDLQKEVDRLKPAEVFLDIPCMICGKPMSNKWTREQVIKIFDS